MIFKYWPGLSEESWSCLHVKEISENYYCEAFVCMLRSSQYRDIKLEMFTAATVTAVI